MLEILPNKRRRRKMILELRKLGRNFARSLGFEKTKKVNRESRRKFLANTGVVVAGPVLGGGKAVGEVVKQVVMAGGAAVVDVPSALGRVDGIDILGELAKRILEFKEEFGGFQTAIHTLRQLAGKFLENESKMIWGKRCKRGIDGKISQDSLRIFSTLHFLNTDTKGFKVSEFLDEKFVNKLFSGKIYGENFYSEWCKLVLYLSNGKKDLLVKDLPGEKLSEVLKSISEEILREGTNGFAGGDSVKLSLLRSLLTYLGRNYNFGDDLILRIRSEVERLEAKGKEEAEESRKKRQSAKDEEKRDARDKEEIPEKGLESLEGYDVVFAVKFLAQEGEKVTYKIFPVQVINNAGKKFELKDLEKKHLCTYYNAIFQQGIKREDKIAENSSMVEKNKSEVLVTTSDKFLIEYLNGKGQGVESGKIVIKYSREKLREVLSTPPENLPF